MYHKIITTFILVLFANAHTENLFTPVIKAGLNISSFYGQDADIYNFKPGFSLGAFSVYRVSNNFSIQAEGVIAIKGAKAGSSLANYTVTHTITYIEFPVLFRYDVRLREQIQAGLFMGPSFAFKVDGKTTSTYNDDSREEDLRYIRSNDLGMNLGIAGTQKNILLELRYYPGLRNIDNSGMDLSMRNAVITVSVGYVFLN